MKYKSDNPYPKIQVEQKNTHYGNILLQDYAGNISEDSAVHIYSYQHFVKFNIDEEFSDAIEHISMVEMIHLELLGKTIKLLGIDPIFATQSNYKNIYWCSNTLNYTTNIIEMLINNIKNEQDAIRQYKYHCSIINDIYIKRLINRIIEDEYIHIEVFKTFLDKYK